MPVFLLPNGRHSQGRTELRVFIQYNQLYANILNLQIARIISKFLEIILISLLLKNGFVAEWLGRALQKLLQQFESARNLERKDHGNRRMAVIFLAGSGSELVRGRAAQKKSIGQSPVGTIVLSFISPKRPISEERLSATKLICSKPRKKGNGNRRMAVVFLAGSGSELVQT